MGIKEQARPVLERIGGEIFGQPDLARNAIDDFDHWYKDGQRPSVVCWRVFVYYLDIDNVLEEALDLALRIPNLRPYLEKTLDPYHAAEVAQLSKIAAHRNFRKFKPYKRHSWESWQYMIAGSKQNDVLRQIYRIDEHETHLSEDFLIAYPDSLDKGWSIPVIAKEWMERGDVRKARFAAQILLLYHNLSSWSGLTGKRMQEIVGVSSSETLFRWFGDFCQEVMEKEEK